MERLDGGAAAIDLAIKIIGERKCRITTWVSRCGTCLGITHWIELRQPVESLIGDPALSPVLPHGSEVAVKGTVLLGQEDNVIHALQACCEVGGYVARINGDGAGCIRASAVPRPAAKSKACCGSGRQGHLRDLVEICGAGWGTRDPGWAAGDRAAARTADINCEL